MQTATIPPHYKSLPTASRQYQRILLEARDLQSSLNQYTDKASLPPTIFTSCRSGELPIVIDTGASMSITPELSDFAVHPTPSTTKSLGSLTTAKTIVSGEGMATWLIEDFNGITRSLSTTAYYVPAATIRLFSPQVYISENPTNSSLLLDSEGIAMTLTCGTILRFPLQKGSNLPIMLTQKALNESTSKCGAHVATSNPIINGLQFLVSTTYTVFMTGTLFHSVAEPSVFVLPTASEDAVFKQANINLSPDQRELLLWHYRLGHINMKWVQSLLQKPRNGEPRCIKPSNNKCSHCETPMCAVCQYAKQKRRQPPKNLTALPPVPTISGLSDNVMDPGQRVSVDLYVAATPGRLPNTFGKEKIESQFTGGAIFVDHASRYIFNQHQHSTTTAESVLSKMHLKIIALLTASKSMNM